jgi:hypothetical protein
VRGGELICFMATRQIERGDFKDLTEMRELYRHEMNCQIVHDSFARRGLSDRMWRVLTA